jgi:Mycobacterium 19 kDa lipoprotein antigen
VNRLVKVAGMASVVVAGVAGCGAAETVPRAAAHLTLDGTSHNTRPPACSRVADDKGQYQTIDIPYHEGKVEAVVLISGDRAIPKWVKIRNIDGFNGSAWAGGVGETHVDLVKSTYTITGSAYGISSKNPNKVITTEFKIVADC